MVNGVQSVPWVKDLNPLSRFLKIMVPNSRPAQSARLFAQGQEHSEAHLLLPLIYVCRTVL